MKVDQKTNSNQSRIIKSRTTWAACEGQGQRAIDRGVVARFSKIAFEFDSFKNLIQAIYQAFRESTLIDLLWEVWKQRTWADKDTVFQVKGAWGVGAGVGCDRLAPRKGSFELGSLLSRRVEWLWINSVDIQASGGGLKGTKRQPFKSYFYFLLIYNVK